MTAPRRGRRTARLVIRHVPVNYFRRDSVSKLWRVLLEGRVVGWIQRDQDAYGVERPVKVHYLDRRNEFYENVAAAKRGVRARFAVR